MSNALSEHVCLRMGVPLKSSTTSSDFGNGESAEARRNRLWQEESRTRARGWKSSESMGCSLSAGSMRVRSSGCLKMAMKCERRRRYECRQQRSGRCAGAAI